MVHHLQRKKVRGFTLLSYACRLAGQDTAAGILQVIDVLSILPTYQHCWKP
jgi:hypothetical protein